MICHFVEIFQDHCEPSSDFWRWWKDRGQLHPIGPCVPSELHQERGPSVHQERLGTRLGSFLGCPSRKA
jgi:hypothetical protein